MTDPKYTAVALLVDRSGSMASIADDATGAIAAFIKDQIAQPGRCTITLADFDSEYQVVYPSTDVNEAPAYRLQPRGSTALLDSIGRLITDFGRELARMAEKKRPANVVFVVQTDGYENASKVWNRELIKNLIADQEAKYNWKFVYLGANQDAIAEGAKMGFGSDSSITYASTHAGMQSTSTLLSNYVGSVRSTGTYAFTDADRDAAAAE